MLAGTACPILAVKDSRAMTEEWRVEVTLEDEGHGLTLGERLRTLDLDDEARKRLGERVIVTRDGPHLFMYAGAEAEAREAAGVARDLASEDGVEATTRITRWDTVAEEWRDVSAPRTEVDSAARQRELEAREGPAGEAMGRTDWELRVDLDSLQDTHEVSIRLDELGIRHHRRWKHLLVPAATEERATELADRVRAVAPAEAGIHLEPAPGSLPHPAFVVIGGHAPGIARDLGL